MSPGQFCSKLLQALVFTSTFSSLPHTSQIAGRKFLHVGKGCPQIIRQFADDSGILSFLTLLLKKCTPHCQIKPHKLTVGRKRSPHPGILDLLSTFFQNFSILCGDRGILGHIPLQNRFCSSLLQKSRMEKIGSLESLWLCAQD